VEAWKEITPEVIKNGFKKAGLESYGTIEPIQEKDAVSDMEISPDDEPRGAMEEMDGFTIDEESEDELVGDMFDGFDELSLED